MLYCVVDIETVDVWRDDRNPDTRICLDRQSFITFKSVCDRLGVKLIEVSELDLYVEGRPR